MLKKSPKIALKAAAKAPRTAAGKSSASKKAEARIASNKAKSEAKSEALKNLIVTSLDDDKAKDIAIIDLRGKSELADYMVIATGTSTRHVGSMADHLARKITDSHLTTFATEGMGQCNWVIIDNPYVVAHLFLAETREFYNLEKMWKADFSKAESLV